LLLFCFVLFFFFFFLAHFFFFFFFSLCSSLFVCLAEIPLELEEWSPPVTEKKAGKRQKKEARKDDDDEDELDLEEEEESKPSSKAKKGKTGKRRSDSDDDDDDDEDFDGKKNKREEEEEDEEEEEEADSSESSFAAKKTKKTSKTTTVEKERPKSLRQTAPRSAYVEANSDDEFGEAPAKPERKKAAPKKAPREKSPERLTEAEQRALQDQEREIDVIHAWRFKPAPVDNVVSPARLDKRLAHLRVDETREKEFFVSFLGLAHHDCQWLDEAVVKFLNQAKWKNFVARGYDEAQDEIPINSAWLVCTRVIDEDEDEGLAQCLWGGLEYERPT
jgi:hypothetical protein